MQEKGLKVQKLHLEVEKKSPWHDVTWENYLKTSDVQRQRDQSIK